MNSRTQTVLRVLTGALLLWALTPQTLQAQDDSAWIRRTIRQTAKDNCEWYGDCYQWHRYQVWRNWKRRQAQAQLRERVREPTRVYAYQRYDDDERYRTGNECRDRRRVVGDQGLSTALAQGQADKAWQQDIRFYLGERFMDIKNAEGVRYECSRSSVGETLGQTFHRCEVSARPCRAPKIEAETGR